MVEKPAVNPAMYNLTLLTDNPLVANILGKHAMIRGTDTMPPQTPVDDGEGWDIPLLPDFIDNPIEDKFKTIFHQTVISVAGLLILAIGLVALILTRGNNG